MSLLKRIEQGKKTGDEDEALSSGGSRLGTLEARIFITVNAEGSLHIGSLLPR